MGEYIVAVKFIVSEEKVDFFLKEVVRNARDSLTEKGCKRFDVSKQENEVFLYEIYSSEDDFNKHLETKHFNEFNKNTGDCIVHKTVETFSGVEIL